MFNPTSPITGATVPGFTSPTYSVTQDASSPYGPKHYLVTTIGGTQAGVVAHSTAKPFTMTYHPPKTWQRPPKANKNGIFPAPGRNVQKVYSVHAVDYATGSTADATIMTQISIPAGAESFDGANVKALIAAHIGLLSQQASGLADTTITGIVG